MCVYVEQILTIVCVIFLFYWIAICNSVKWHVMYVILLDFTVFKTHVFLDKQHSIICHRMQGYNSQILKFFVKMYVKMCCNIILTISKKPETFY